MKKENRADALYRQTHPHKSQITVPTALFALNLCAQEVAIYCYLLFLQSRARHVCHPSYTDIGQNLGMSANTVAKYVRALEDKHLIATKRTSITAKRGAKLNGALQYQILPIADAVRYNHEKLVLWAAAENESRVVRKILKRQEEMREAVLASAAAADDERRDEAM